ncbi:NAD-dependent deacylase [Desulfobulbus sp.]|uniref:SIR2 family NAD-dependent protein deacylase n=1 Tax=Desulfobulbus sp. TaxID=895 RepID=UPI00286F9655|nr:NAD-dependent deacylase [Desulfobulbus sp.]
MPTSPKQTIVTETGGQAYCEAAGLLKTARKAVALTGAGISVGSGIPDFRSPGGLWSVFSPEEYATIEVFRRHPAKAWELFRALGKVLVGKRANAAHQALAELERQGWLQAVVTQNIDNLHQQAGSSRVFEIHGDHQHLHCLQCGAIVPLLPGHLDATDIPCCAMCGFPLKPNVVLFGEAVRDLDAIHDCLADCDLLLVIGTSAQVYPAAALPALVRQHGGRIMEFNREPSLGTVVGRGDFLFQGDVLRTLPALADACGPR